MFKTLSLYEAKRPILGTNMFSVRTWNSGMRFTSAYVLIKAKHNYTSTLSLQWYQWLGWYVCPTTCVMGPDEILGHRTDTWQIVGREKQVVKMDGIVKEKNNIWHIDGLEQGCNNSSTLARNGQSFVLSQRYIAWDLKIEYRLQLTFLGIKIDKGQPDEDLAINCVAPMVLQYITRLSWCLSCDKPPFPVGIKWQMKHVLKRQEFA